MTLWDRLLCWLGFRRGPIDLGFVSPAWRAAALYERGKRGL